MASGTRGIAVSLVVVFSLLQASAALAAPAGPKVLAPALGPLTFGDPMTLGGSGSEHPWMAASGANVYVLWSGGTNAEIYFRRSATSGASFADAVNVSQTSARSWDPEMAATSGSVYVVWVDEFTLNGDVFLARGEDGGSVVHPRVNLSNSPGAESRDPVAAAAGDSVYVVWNEDTGRAGGGPTWVDLVLRASTDRGQTFGEMTELPDGMETGKASVAAAGRYVHVVSGKGTYCRSTDGGATFSDPISLFTHGSAWGQCRIALAGNAVYVAYLDSEVRGGNEDVFLRVSRDNGGTFGEPVNVSNTEARSTDAKLEASGSNVYLAWRDDVGGDEDILFRASSDGARRFGAVMNLSDDDRASTSPSVCVSGSCVYVAWQDLRPDTVCDVLLRSSTDSGRGFGDVVNLSNVTPRGSCQLPQVVAHDRGVYAIWLDHVRGIVFRKGTRATRLVPPSRSATPKGR